MKIKFLKTVNIPYNVKEFCCEDCGYLDSWENYTFDPDDEQDEFDVDVSGLTLGEDYVEI